MIRRSNLHKIVFYLVFIFGSLLVFLFPPTQNPDEGSHFTRTIMVSKGSFQAEKRDGVWGQDIPTSLVNYIDSHAYMIFNMDQKYRYRKWYEDSHAKITDDEVTFRTYTTQASSPLYYLPQVAGLTLGKFVYALLPVDFNWAAALYFSRIGNLLFYAIGFSLGIYFAERYRASLTFIALTPMALSLGASLNYDVMVIVSCVGFFSTVAWLSEKSERLNKSHVLLLAGLAFLVGHGKAVYTPVLLSLVLLLSALGWRKWLGLALLCGVFACLGILVSAVVFGLPQTENLQEGIRGQTQYVLAHWQDMPGLIWRSAVEYAPNHFITLMGNLGSFDTNFALPALVFWSIAGMLALVADVGATEKKPAVIAPVAALAGSYLISLLAIYLAMYITWTSYTTGVGANVIDSVQGRYSLPLLPFVMAALVLVFGVLGRFLRNVAGHALEAQMAMTLVIQCLTLFVVVARYWISPG